MDAKTKQAWEYIKTLNYYSKTWKQPLGDLIYQLIDNMDEQQLYKDRQQFIEGIKNLKSKKWLVGQVEISQTKKEIILNNVKLNIFLRIWFWLPYKWGSDNKEEDIKENELKKNQDNIKMKKYAQLVVNLITIVASIITIFEFVKGLIH